MTDLPLVSLENLSLGYGGRIAVRKIAGAIQPGSLTAVVGPNGAGKSTLLKGLAGLLKPLAGRIYKPGLARADIAYVPQQIDIDRTFPARVFDLVALGRFARRGMFARATSADRAAVDAAIAAVGLAGVGGRPLAALSGGELQRALFARAIAQDARFILLDEPFAAIDAATVADLLALMRAWSGEGRAAIVVLHDLNIVRRSFPQTLLLAGDPIAWGPTADVLVPQTLAKAGRFGLTWTDEAPVPIAMRAA